MTPLRTPDQIVRWLRREPHPVRVRIGDGKAAPHVSIPQGQTGPRVWRDACETLLAQQALTIHALDASGGILRSLEIATEDEADAAPELAAPETAKQSEMVLMAQLLLEAGDRGAARATDGLTSAVNALIQVVQVCVDRLASVEDALADARDVAGQGGQTEQLLGAVVGSALAPRPPATPPTANGKEPH